MSLATVWAFAVLAVALCGCGFGCGSSSRKQAAPAETTTGAREPPVDEETVEPPATGHVDEAGEAGERSTPTGAASILLEGDGDLDGDPGDEHLVLYTDGRLEAGAWRGEAELTEMHEYWVRKQAALRVVVLDRRRAIHALLVALPIAQFEDPPNRYQLFVPESGHTLRRVLDITLVLWESDVEVLVFPEDGTARYLEDGWTACDRTGHPTRVPRQRVTLAMDGEEMTERSRRDSGEVQICDQLAACPYVYVLGDDGPVFAGEILRDLRGQATYAAQSLGLGAIALESTSLRIRIAEEKPEITYLDEIHLEVNGLHIPPRSCTGATPRPAYCLADGEPYTLRQGENLDLIFDASAPGAELHATGYYVPTPSPGAP